MNIGTERDTVMRSGREGFEEVMIVNPYDPGAGLQGASTMLYPSAFGYYHQPPEAYGYGYGFAAPASYGYYAWPLAESDDLGGYAEDDPYGEADEFGETDDYGEADEFGDYAEDDPYGFYAEDDPYGDYAEDDPYGETDEYGDYAEDDSLSEVPEMVGYGEDEYGEYDPALAGYVRDMDPAFNPGCPLPTNVAGFGEPDDFSGYVRPATVNARVQSFTPQPGASQGVPPTFAPLW